MNKQTNFSPVAPNNLAQNSLYNLFTYVVLMIVGLWTIPVIVRGLSKESFGLLSLVWVFVGYFSLLDLGFSRATTKFLSQSLSAHQDIEARKIIWTALTTNFVLGVVFSVLLWISSPVVLSSILSIPIDLMADAERSLHIVALAFPFVLCGGIARSVQMALHRFDLVNIFQMMVGIAQWVGSVIVIMLGYGLLEIVMVTVASRIVSTMLAVALLPRIIPGAFRHIRFFDQAVFAKLFAFGGWVSVSQILTPLLVYVDRIFIGAFLSLSAVAYYTVQQEVLLRLLIIPQSIATTLYPAFSEHSARHPDGSQTERVYFRSLNYIILLMLPIVVVFFVYAENILRLWVGEEYAANSASVMQVFALGLFFNALAQIPFTALHAYGYPEVTAKFHLYELPLTVGLNLTLIPWLGIIGAALTWSTRVLVDTVLLFVFFHKHVGQSYQALTRHLPERSALVYSLPFVACLSALFVDHASIKLFVMAVFAVLYVLGIWVYGFDDTDRKFFFQLCAKMFRRF